jgi:hypothetical protein
LVNGSLGERALLPHGRRSSPHKKASLPTKKTIKMAQWYSAAPPVVQGQPYYGESPYGGQQQHQQHYYEQKPTTASAYQQQAEFGGAAVDNNSSSTKPIRQRGCRDAIWAILFYAHLGGIAFITVVYTPQVVNGAIENYSNNNSGGEQRLLQEEQDNNGDGGDSSSSSGGGYDAMDIDIDPAALGSMIAIMGALACLLSSLALGFMMRFAEGLIKVRLFAPAGPTLAQHSQLTPLFLCTCYPDGPDFQRGLFYTCRHWFVA